MSNNEKDIKITGTHEFFFFFFLGVDKVLLIKYLYLNIHILSFKNFVIWSQRLIKILKMLSTSYLK